MYHETRQKWHRTAVTVIITLAIITTSIRTSSIECGLHCPLSLSLCFSFLCHVCMFLRLFLGLSPSLFFLFHLIFFRTFPVCSENDK